MIEKLVTILTFTYPHELAAVKGRLEAEGIECFTKDELTTQINPFCSNAIGGVKLQIKESDEENAVALLKELGYIKEDDFQKPDFFEKIENITSKIHVIRRLRFELRLIVIALIVVTLLTTLLYFLVLSSVNAHYEQQNNQMSFLWVGRTI